MKNGYMDWQVVRTSPAVTTSAQNMACFVPKLQRDKIQVYGNTWLTLNDVGPRHGKGDFIVCNKLPNGQPNLQDRWVVNGEVFARTYNNQGWGDCLDLSSNAQNDRVTIDKLPNLIPQKLRRTYAVDEDMVSQKADTFVRKLQEHYKFEVRLKQSINSPDYKGLYGTMPISGEQVGVKYEVTGNFIYNDQKFNSTIIEFVCRADKENSALAVGIYPRILGKKTVGMWRLPYSTNRVSPEGYYPCDRNKTIKDINCEDEVKHFIASEKGASKELSMFLNNRHKDEEVVEDGLLKQILAALRQCEQSCVQQMRFRVSYSQKYNSIHVDPDVIEDYKSRVNSAQLEGKDKSVADKVKEFVKFTSTIGITNDKKSIMLKCYNKLTDGSQELTCKIDIPNTQQGVQDFVSNIRIYAGVMGYIPAGTQNSFSFNSIPSKFEYDGIEAYTISSSGINRKLRLQDYESESNHRGYERVGVESQRLYRAIIGADSYFDKVALNSDLIVYRGVPGKSAVLFSGADSIETLSGHVMTNTAYTSSTLNLHSSMMFAKDVNIDSDNGVIFAIKLPAGMHADYIHNIAGWKEQFEVLWDRKYDIVIGNKICSFLGGTSFKYSVFEATVREHQPLEPIPAYIDKSHHSNIPNINCFDVNGRVNFDYEMIRGTMREAFDIIKKRGVSGVQYQEKLQIDPANRDFVVVRSGKGDDDTVVDLAFSYNSSTNLIDIVKFTAKENISITDDNGNVYTEFIRSHWTDRNRNNGAVDRNFSWETYNANSKSYRDNVGSFAITPKSSIMLRGQYANDTSHLADAVAFTILEYVKYSKDVTLLPMQDVARYFDTVFKVTVTSEGYELKDSAPVNRVGRPEDENDGYVPLKYIIDGDNDDILVLMMRMSRDENGKLQLEYRGASNNNRVKEQKQLRWNIFNQDIMERTCYQILYVFASQLNLNHTRKVDQLMRFVSKNMGVDITNPRVGLYKDKNIHERGSAKVYNMWSNNRKNKTTILVDVHDRQADFQLSESIDEKTVARKSGTIPTKISIVEMYHQFRDLMEQTSEIVGVNR